MSEDFVSSKLKAVIDKIKEIVDKKEKMIIFTYIIQMIHLICKNLKNLGINYLTMNGSTS